MTRTFMPLLAASLCAVLALPAAQAQKPNVLGSGTGSGKVLTRDELRTCIKDQASLAQRSADNDALRTTLATEKAELLAATTALKGDKAQIQKTAAEVDSINQRLQAVSDKIADWNVRWKDFEDAGRNGGLAERQRTALLREKKGLEAESVAIEAERGTVGVTQQGAAKFNEQAAALDKRTMAWNARNAAAAAASEALLQDRDLWAAECSNRRYREEDENAIRKEK